MLIKFKKSKVWTTKFWVKQKNKIVVSETYLQKITRFNLKNMVKTSHLSEKIRLKKKNNHQMIRAHLTRKTSQLLRSVWLMSNSSKLNKTKQWILSIRLNKLKLRTRCQLLKKNLSNSWVLIALSSRVIPRFNILTKAVP